VERWLLFGEVILIADCTPRRIEHPGPSRDAWMPKYRRALWGVVTRGASRPSATAIQNEHLRLVLPDHLGVCSARRSPVVLALRPRRQLDRPGQHILVVDRVEDV
jgi:hypothetical protein